MGALHLPKDRGEYGVCRKRGLLFETQQPQMDMADTLVI